jgi:hypothetical protein
LATQLKYAVTSLVQVVGVTQLAQVVVLTSPQLAAATFSHAGRQAPPPPVAPPLAPPLLPPVAVVPPLALEPAVPPEAVVPAVLEPAAPPPAPPFDLVPLSLSLPQPDRGTTVTRATKGSRKPIDLFI